MDADERKAAIPALIKIEGLTPVLALLIADEPGLISADFAGPGSRRRRPTRYQGGNWFFGFGHPLNLA